MANMEREYATALFELATGENALEAYLEALYSVKVLFAENPEYSDLLSSPAVSLEERIGMIDEAFGTVKPENVVIFLKVLCENGDMSIVLNCIDEFFELYMESTKRTKANIYSAVELTADQKKKIVSKLEKLTAKKVECEYTVDKTLIGGIRIEVDSTTYDGSVKHLLSEMKDVMSS